MLANLHVEFAGPTLVFGGLEHLSRLLDEDEASQHWQRFVVEESGWTDVCDRRPAAGLQGPTAGALKTTL